MTNWADMLSTFGAKNRTLWRKKTQQTILSIT